jgi:hypothetical protein
MWRIKLAANPKLYFMLEECLCCGCKKPNKARPAQASHHHRQVDALTGAVLPPLEKLNANKT